MFTPAFRLFLIAMTLAMGVWGIGTSDHIAILCFPASVLLGIGYFRYGTIWLAFRAFKKGRKDRARRLLDTVRWPRLLSRQSRAYYELIRGDLASEDGDPRKAEVHYRAALAGNLRTDNNRCAVTVALAETLLDQGRGDLSREILDSAERMPHTEDMEPHLGALRGKIDGATGGRER